MPNEISIDLELATSNSSSMVQSGDALPSGSTVALVDGNATEPAASAFTNLLETKAGILGQRVDAVKQFVAANAEALAHAVATLQKRDELSASDAQQATALIDTAAAQPAAGTGASTGAAAGGRAGVQGVLPGVPQ